MDGVGHVCSGPVSSEFLLTATTKQIRNEASFLQDYLGQIETWNPGAVTPMHETLGTLESEKSETDSSIKLFNLSV